MPRYFVLPEQIIGQEISIIGEDAKHLGTVLRARPGDTVTICDGQGADYETEVAEVSKENVLLKIRSKQQTVSEPEVKITLFQGVPKGDKLDTVIQKCVELGVARIVPMITERVVVRLSGKEEKKAARYQRIAEAAAKQSGRGRIPQVAPILDFDAAITEAKQLDAAIFFYEEERERQLREILQTFQGKTLGIFIGPEGGFSPEEAEKARMAGFPAATLGKRILRTETAGMAAIAILLYELEQGR